MNKNSNFKYFLKRYACLQPVILTNLFCVTCCSVLIIVLTIWANLFSFSVNFCQSIKFNGFGLVLQVRLDSKSIKINGFGLGFNLFYGLSWIQNPLSLTDSNLDSTCYMDQNLGELCFRPQIGLNYGLFLALIWIQNRICV